MLLINRSCPANRANTLGLYQCVLTADQGLTCCTVRDLLYYCTLLCTTQILLFHASTVLIYGKNQNGFIDWIYLKYDETGLILGILQMPSLFNSVKTHFQTAVLVSGLSLPTQKHMGHIYRPAEAVVCLGSQHTDGAGVTLQV